MNPIQSSTFNYLRFPLIVGVVFIHAYSTELTASREALAASDNIDFWNTLRYLISQIIARISVPFFLFMSGFLFFYNVKKFDLSLYKSKIGSRVKTLLIPYLFWNNFVFLLFMIGQNLPWTANSFQEMIPIANDSYFFDYINQITKLQGYPIAYQFWFIRDLFIVCLFSPIIYIAIKKLKYTIIIVLIALWIIGIPYISMSIVFFSIGAMFNILGIDILETFEKRYKTILFLYPIVAILDLLTQEYAIHQYIHKTGLLLGVVFVFNLVAHFIAKGKIKGNLFLSNASFFVFAIHEPILAVVKTVGFKIFYPFSDFTFAMIYFSSTFFVIILGLGLYFLICKTVPKILILLTGKRI